MLCFRNPPGTAIDKSVVESTTIGNQALRSPQTQATLLADNRLFFGDLPPSACVCTINLHMI
jgi:hypothetical protein